MAGNYYFSHDSRAQDDEKIIALRMEHGWAGYGLYWAIVERLRDAEDYTLKANFKALGFALMADEETVRSVVEDYGLFSVEDGRFFSESLIRRMERMDDKSRKAKEAAEARWAKKNVEKESETPQITSEMQVHAPSNASAMQTHSDRNAHPMQIKENKRKEKKYINTHTSHARAREGPEFSEPTPKSVDDPDLVEFFKSLDSTPEAAANFFNFYDSQGWVKTNGMPVTSWRSLAHQWINDDKFNPGKRSRASPGRKPVTTQTEPKYKDPNHEW